MPSTVLQVAILAFSGKNPAAELNSMKIRYCRSSVQNSTCDKKAENTSKADCQCLCADPVLSLQRSLLSKTECCSMPEAFHGVQLPFFPRCCGWSLKINISWEKTCIMILLIEYLVLFRGAFCSCTQCCPAWINEYH